MYKRTIRDIAREEDISATKRFYKAPIRGCLYYYGILIGLLLDVPLMVLLLINFHQ